MIGSREDLERTGTMKYEGMDPVEIALEIYGENRRDITVTEIGSVQDLDEAMKAFKANPNTTNQMVLERAMRVYQSNVTAVEHGFRAGLAGVLGKESR
jgi:hypothetical protein